MGDPNRPLLRWHGGKWLLAPWVIENLPPHRIYVEPFGGAGSVLMRKPRSQSEVWNDLDGDLVNLFRVLRSEQSERLIQEVRLTPFARDEFREAYEPTSDPVERARRMIVRSFMGFGSNAVHRLSGFRGNGIRAGTLPQHNWSSYPEALAAIVERVQGVVVENKPAIDLIAQQDSAETLFYVDPPYVLASRGDAGSDYAHELSDEDHRVLLTVLRGVKGMVVLSGYSHPIYDDMLSDWQRIERASLADGARERVEVLWINPSAISASSATKPTNLFGEAA